MARSASMLANVRCVLCGDLGGTNSRLELFRLQHTASKRDLEAIGTEPPLYAQTYKTNNLPGDFTELLHAFLTEANVGLVELAAGCLAVAGPVEEGDRVTFTNLGWRIAGIGGVSDASRARRTPCAAGWVLSRGRGSHM